MTNEEIDALKSGVKLVNKAGVFLIFRSHSTDEYGHRMVWLEVPPTRGMRRYERELLKDYRVSK